MRCCDWSSDVCSSDLEQADTIELLFLSTLSLRRATCHIGASLHVDRISIHALLAESDGGSGAGSWPHGIFLSTLSLRRATHNPASQTNLPGISIHALLAESDLGRHRGNNGGPVHFYPRSPCGERRAFIHSKQSKFWYFYPRSPCGERRTDRRPILF